MKNDRDSSKKIAEYVVSVMLKEETSKHRDVFEEWIKENPTATSILNELTNEELLQRELDDFSTIDKQKSAKKMLRKLATYRHKIRFIKSISVAAALIVVSFLIWPYFVSNEEIELGDKTATVEMKSVRLIIDDLEEVELNKDTITSNALRLYRTGKHEIAYTKIEKRAITKNRLIVPSKEKFTIRLSDGTKVTLNANSELIFPSEFTGETREVKIKGEALFEVEKNEDHPFIVHCDTISIQVYGTVFNVNNRTSFQTFLCEGSVGVSINNQLPQMLSPNQLITIIDGESRIDTVANGEKYIDWTTGYFIFDADKLESVIEKLSQWYETKLVIGSGEDQVLITGSFERTLQLEDIIQSIEMVSGVQLKEIK